MFQIEKKRPVRVEICGSLGSGKSTIATGLKNNGFYPVHEEFEDNPYLAESRSNPTPENHYNNQLWFLERVEKQICGLKPNAKPYILDFSPTLAAAYIDIAQTTDAMKKDLFEKSARSRAKMGQPKIIIVPTLSVDEQMKRINERGRSFDRVPREYVEKLDAAIEKQLSLLPKDIKVLRVDTHTIDYRKPEEARKLAQQIKAALGEKKGLFS